MWERLIELLAFYPNLAATSFGLMATAVSGVLGYLLKRPLQRQTLEIQKAESEQNLATDLFKAQILGFENQIVNFQALARTQANRIAYLESQEAIRNAYEADLLRRLRECEERHLRNFPIGDEEGLC